MRKSAFDNFKKGARHHWWPIGLQKKSWIDQNGYVKSVNPSGELKDLNPRVHAKLSDGHNFFFGKNAMWNSTFEHDFDAVDIAFPRTIQKLQLHMHKHLTLDKDKEVTWRRLSQSNSLLKELCASIASLSLRSPAHRHKIEMTISDLHRVNDYDIYDRFSQKQISNTVKGNIYGKLRQLTNDLFSRGVVTIVFSDQEDFIFGDGFFQNLPISDFLAVLSPLKILVPITPKISLMYHELGKKILRAIYSYKASSDDVKMINEATQIHSKNWLFYKNKPPVIGDHFKCNAFHECITPDPVDIITQKFKSI